MGAGRQGVPLRDRRGERLAGTPLQGALAAPRLPLHVRARLHGRVSVVFGDRGRVRRLCRPSGQPRCNALGGVAGAAREAAGVQAADGVDVSLGIRARQRLQLRLPRVGDRGATTCGRRRIQLPARGGAAGRRDTLAGDPRRRCQGRGHDRHRRGHLRAREARHERVRARGRHRLPHLFHLRARTGRALGRIPVARPRPQGAQRDRLLVAPPRRVRRR